MPYVVRNDRPRLDGLFMQKASDFHFPKNEGELNYVITRLLNMYINSKGLKYATLNQVVGVLECAKLELYRRIVAPYEDTKIQENGDVYEV